MFRKLLPALLVGLAFAAAGCDLDPKVTAETAEGVIHVYSSPRCSACQMARPIIQEMKEQGFKIRVIDVNKNPRKAGKARVHMIPTFIHYNNGKETRRIVGTASVRELKRMFVPRN